jgi:Transglutaminase-like superfamily
MTHSPRAYLLFAEAWMWTALGRLLLVFVPFRKIAPILGRAMQESRQQGGEAKAEEVRVAVARASKRVPWQARCFEQAIAAKMMLKVRGVRSTVYFAVKKNETSMLAHAWLRVNGKTITGGPDANDFAVISWFGD